MDWNPATGCQRLNICQEASIEATEKKQRFESLVDIGSVTQSLPRWSELGAGVFCAVSAAATLIVVVVLAGLS